MLSSPFPSAQRVEKGGKARRASGGYSLFQHLLELRVVGRQHAPLTTRVVVASLVDRAGMTELKEAFTAVVVPHSRCAHAAERRIFQRRVHDHIVDGYAARQG